MTKERSFQKSAVILAVCGLAAKVMGALYRIPLTNLLGAEGMGMYQLIFSIYALILALTTGGIPLAVSRMTAERAASGKDTRGVLKSAIFMVTGASTIIALILVFLGRYIAALQGNGEVSGGYAVIAPAVILVGALSMVRGWFQGHYDVIPTAVSQILEQSFKLVFGLLLARLLSPKGLIYAVYGALLGVGISEFVAFIYLFISYAVRGKKFGNEGEKDTLKNNIGEIAKISFIFAITGFIVPFSQFIDSILIINILKYTGVSTARATSEYGLFSGTVMSVINMPVVLTLSLSIALIPVVTSGRVGRDLEGIVAKSATSIKLSYVLGMPAAVLMFLFAPQIMSVLYPGLSASEIQLSISLMRIACFSVLFSAQREIYASLLMALDRTADAAKNTFFAVVLKTAVMVLLLFTTGINGAAWGALVLGITATFLNVATFRKLLGKSVKLVKNISTITLSNAIMAIVATGVAFSVANNIAALVVGFVVSAVVYLICLMLFGVFTGGELEGIPFSRYFDKLTLKIRFWEHDKK